MSETQYTPREKFERNLAELISLWDRCFVSIKDEAGKIISWEDVKGDELRAELQRLAISKGMFSKKELALRQKRYAKLGEPALNSPEWLAELEQIRKRFPKKPRRPSSSSVNTDPNDISSLYWQVLMLAARKAHGEAVEPIMLPSQSGGAWRGLDGKSPPQVLTGAEARRLYRWLWRLAPGLLNACDDELRKEIRDAGGIA